MLIPSSSTVMEDKESSLKLDVFSAYPMEMRGLDMQQPKSLTITRDGKVEDLKAMLKPATIIGHQAWRAVYEVKQPGVYQFAMEPAPYFDPEEDRFIIHYTKTVVAAFGDEKGWAAISSRAVCCWTVNLSPVPRWKWNTIIMESIA